MFHPLTKQLLEAYVLHAYKEGNKVQQIAMSFLVSVTRVYPILKSAGVFKDQRNPENKSKALLARDVEHMYEQKVPIKRISIISKLSKKKVKAILGL